MVKDLVLFVGGLFVVGFDVKCYLEGKGFCLMDCLLVGIKIKCFSGCCF